MKCIKRNNKQLLRVTNEEGADPQLSSGMSAFIHIEPVIKLLAFFTLQCDVSKDFTTDPRISAPRDSIPQQQGTNEESRSDEISKIIKLDDLSNLMRDVRSHFIYTDPLEDEPIIVTDESEEEEAERYEGLGN
ncbi:hypothetical protein Tco_1214262 [Tanacetum coccineum]